MLTSKIWRVVTLAALTLALVPLLTACYGPSATTASCAFVVGDGQNGDNARVHRIIYPGQSVNDNNSEKVWYVPCNSRNYIVNDGTEKNANGELIGDSHTLLEATLNSGVTIQVAATAYWTLNESNQAMRDFYNVCFKYTCASSEDQGGNANYASKGWNGMLGEDFYPALNRSAKRAAKEAGIDDSIYLTQDPTQYQKLGNQMSMVFADEVRATLGYSEDLFCGSGNSAWSDPNNPGRGTYNCSSVRIVVDQVTPLLTQSGQGAQTLNQQRLENAKALYGPDAGYWLGLQDSITECKNAGTTCVISVGGSAAPAVSLPTNNATPTATPKAGK